MEACIGKYLRLNFQISWLLPNFSRTPLPVSIIVIHERDGDSAKFMNETNVIGGIFF